jgi:Fe-S-cluster containining protein
MWKMGDVFISRVVAFEPYVKGFNAAFHCQKCGECCDGHFTRTEVKQSDIDRMAKFMKLSSREFRDTHLEPDGNMRQPCNFYRTKVGCVIYDARPDT